MSNGFTTSETNQVRDKHAKPEYSIIYLSKAPFALFKYNLNVQEFDSISREISGI